MVERANLTRFAWLSIGAAVLTISLAAACRTQTGHSFVSIPDRSIRE